ncbi:MAG TPA: BMP family ABC transporter substrate-binding protein, partial [Blastocatellia bacterium]|nr:BMP family ABC transporter substrate-binding protein [Blastocatellia bacterium]
MIEIYEMVSKIFMNIAHKQLFSKAILLLLIPFLLLINACSMRSNASNGGEKKVHVGIVFDIGGKDDRSFNAAAYEGVKRAARELPIVLRDAEPGDPTSLEPAMRAFAQMGYDLIIGVGFAQAPIVEQVARDYPNIHFVIVDGICD